MTHSPANPATPSVNGNSSYGATPTRAVDVWSMPIFPDLTKIDEQSLAEVDSHTAKPVADITWPHSENHPVDPMPVRFYPKPANWPGSANASPEPHDPPDAATSAVPEVAISAVPEVAISAVPEVAISAVPEVAISAVPEAAISPAPEVAISAVPEVAISPAPEVATNAAPEVAISPVPVAVPVVEPAEDRFQRGPTSLIWGMPLDRVRMEESVDAIEAMIEDRKPRYVITANLNYAMLLSNDESLQKVTDDAAMILADGQPMVWRSHLGRCGRLPERVTGSELIYRLAERAAMRKWRIYFLGAEPGVALRCANALAKRYPGLQVAGVQSPPFRKLTDAEQEQQRKAIVDARADILLVAFGQPKGERWIHEHYQSLGVPVSIQLGASFDFVAGTSQRAPKIWQRIGLEWAYRMFTDPARLIPRYSSNAWFLVLSLIRDWRDYVTENFGDQAGR